MYVPLWVRSNFSVLEGASHSSKLPRTRRLEHAGWGSWMYVSGLEVRLDQATPVAGETGGLSESSPVIRSS